jgi:hypothetical protein
VTFYHPELLEFFSRHVGFEEVTSGENEVYSKPLLRDVEMEFPRSMSPERDRFPELVKRPANIWARPYWLVKRFMVRLFVKPYVDHLHSEILDLREVVREMIEAHNRLIDVVDRPFEAFIIADKLGDGDAAGNQ